MLLRLNGYGSSSCPADRERRLAAERETISSQGNSDYLPLAWLDEQPDRCLSFFLALEYRTGCEVLR
jgi:hypothetical protein